MGTMKKMVPLLAVAILCVGCAAEPEKTGSTPSRLYNASPDKAYQASVLAFQDLGLEVFKQDPEHGFVEGGRKPAFGQGSENVGVYIEPTAAGQTKVSIDNHKAMLGYAFAVDWTDKMFAQIDMELKNAH